jgi:hypothetical protein
MANKPLPYEEARCFDAKCQVRHGCRRYLERKDPAIRHCAIMRPTYGTATTPRAPSHVPQEDPPA